MMLLVVLEYYVIKMSEAFFTPMIILQSMTKLRYSLILSITAVSTLTQILHYMVGPRKG